MPNLGLLRTQGFSGLGEISEELGIPISTLGVGLSYREDLLHELARTSGGTYSSIAGTPFTLDRLIRDKYSLERLKTAYYLEPLDGRPALKLATERQSPQEFGASIWRWYNLKFIATWGLGFSSALDRVSRAIRASRAIRDYQHLDSS